MHIVTYSTQCADHTILYQASFIPAVTERIGHASSTVSLHCTKCIVKSSDACSLQYRVLCTEDTEYESPALIYVSLFQIIDDVIALFPHHPAASAKDVNLHQHTCMHGGVQLKYVGDGNDSVYTT